MRSGFMGTGSHLLHPRNILKDLLFCHHCPNFFPSLWWEWAWNPNTAITHVDNLELCEYYRHPDWLSGPPGQCSGWDSAVSCTFVLGRVEKLYKPISSESLDVVGCRSWTMFALYACTKNFLYAVNSVKKFLFTRESAEKWLCVAGLVEQNFNFQLRHSSTD